MMIGSDVNEALLGGGIRAAKFEAIGDVVVGIVQGAEVRQRLDFDTQKPMVWDDGKPRNQVVITLATDERDGDDDDGVRALYAPIPSAMRTAIAEALRKVGAKGLTERMKLGVKFTGEESSTRRGRNATKLYTAKVELPVQSVSLDEMGAPDDDDVLPF